MDNPCKGVLHIRSPFEQRRCRRRPHGIHPYQRDLQPIPAGLPDGQVREGDESKLAARYFGRKGVDGVHGRPEEEVGLRRRDGSCRVGAEERDDCPK